MRKATIEPVDVGDPESQWAMAEYVAELVRHGVLVYNHEAGAEPDTSLLRPPRGLFFLARLPEHTDDDTDDAISEGSSAGTDVRPTLGCAGLTHLDEHRSEIKRMWVHPNARGERLGRRLLETCEEEARRNGRSRCVLDTHSSLTAAISLYRTNGYHEVDRYNDNPNAQHWFERDLDRP